jgi:peptidoglycan/LPS O-acetylase OafA/YrhL
VLDFVLTWSITVALASVSFRWFEQPVAELWRDRRAALPRPAMPAQPTTVASSR